MQNNLITSFELHPVQRVVRGAQYESLKQYFQCTIPMHGNRICGYAGTFSDLVVHSAAHWNCAMMVCRGCSKHIFDTNEMYRHMNPHTSQICKAGISYISPNFHDRNSFVDLWKSRNVFIIPISREEFMAAKASQLQANASNPSNTRRETVTRTPGYDDSDDEVVPQEQVSRKRIHPLGGGGATPARQPISERLTHASNYSTPPPAQQSFQGQRNDPSNRGHFSDMNDTRGGYNNPNQNQFYAGGDGYRNSLTENLDSSNTRYSPYKRNEPNSRGRGGRHFENSRGRGGKYQNNRQSDSFRSSNRSPPPTNGAFRSPSRAASSSSRHQDSSARSPPSRGDSRSRYSSSSNRNQSNNRGSYNQSPSPMKRNQTDRSSSRSARVSSSDNVFRDPPPSDDAPRQMTSRPGFRSPTPQVEASESSTRRGRDSKRRADIFDDLNVSRLPPSLETSEESGSVRMTLKPPRAFLNERRKSVEYRSKSRNREEDDDIQEITAIHREQAKMRVDGRPTVKVPRNTNRMISLSSTPINTSSTSSTPRKEAQKMIPAITWPDINLNEITPAKAVKSVEEIVLESSSASSSAQVSSPSVSRPSSPIEVRDTEQPAAFRSPPPPISEDQALGKQNNNEDDAREEQINIED